MQLDAPTATLYAAVIGGCAAAIVSSGFTLLNNTLVRRSEERRQIREIGLKIGMANFETAKQISQALANHTNEVEIIPALQFFVREGIDLAEAVSNRAISADAMAKKINDAQLFSRDVRRACKLKY